MTKITYISNPVVVDFAERQKKGKVPPRVEEVVVETGENPSLPAS